MEGRSPVVGGHPVDGDHLWSVAWASGIFSVVWSLLAAAFFLSPWGYEIVTSDPWNPLLNLVGGQFWIVGTIIGIGGICGTLGLVLPGTPRGLSIASAVIGIAWNAWLLALLWYAALVLGQPSSAAIFAILAGMVFVFRFVLLFRRESGGGPG